MATEDPVVIEAPVSKPDPGNKVDRAVVPSHRPDLDIPSKEPKPSGACAVLSVEQKQNEKTQYKLEKAQKIGNNTLYLKGSKQQTKVVKHKKEVFARDDQGNTIRVIRTDVEEETYTHIFQILYIEAKSNTQSIEASSPTCGEKAIDLCCQSLVCHFKNPFKSKCGEIDLVETNKLMNATRRRGRAKGWTILKGLIFPFVSDVTRDFWVAFQLLFTLVLLSLSASTFALAGANYKVFHAIHLAFSALAAFLAVVDCIVSFTQCSTCKACIFCFRERANRAGQGGNNPGNQPLDKNNGTETSTAITNIIDEEAAMGTCENDQENKSTSADNTTKCRKCFNTSKSSIDMARIFLTEFILVPIIFCDMFEVATGKGFNSDVVYHRIGFALMLYDSIGLIVFVFILRLVILGRMIYSEQRMHPTLEDIETILKKRNTNQTGDFIKQKYNLDGAIKKNSLKIQIVFFLHVFGQIIAHILMLVAVGAKIAYDTQNYGTRNIFINVDTNVLASGFLWYMMIATYILPIVGIGIFFVVYNYWVQQFLIGICIDFVKLLQIGEDSTIVVSSSTVEKHSETISTFVVMTSPPNESNLPTEYKEMKEINIGHKLSYPFKSPSLIVLCILYFLSQFAFVLCCGFTLDDTETLQVIFLNQGGWFWYVALAALVGIAMNIYSFLVAGLWIMIAIGSIIAVIVVCLVCLIAACCSDSDSNN